jgi:hypothetical protein
MAGKKDNARTGLWGSIKCFVRVDWPIGSPLKTEKVRLPACRKLIFSGWVVCVNSGEPAGDQAGELPLKAFRLAVQWQVGRCCAYNPPQNLFF